MLANLAALSLEEDKYSQAVTYSREALKLSDKNYIVWDTLPSRLPRSR